jgi:hypothetical protein
MNNMFDSNKTRKTKPWWKNKKLIGIVILVVLAFIIAKFYPQYWTKDTKYTLFILGMGIGVSDGIYEKAKNRTNGRLVSGNKHFSLNTDAIANPGDLRIFSLGGVVHKLMTPLSGDEGTLITRKELVEKIGENNYVIHGDLHRVELSEVPIAAKKEIEANGDFSGPYYMCRVPKYDYVNAEDIRDKIEELMDLEDTNERLNNRINELRIINQMSLEDLEDLMDFANRVGEGQSKLSKAISKLGDRSAKDEYTEGHRR